MSRIVSVTLLMLGILLGIVGIVTGYAVGVITDNPAADAAIPRSQLNLLFGCAVTTMAAGGVVAVLGLIGFGSKPVPRTDTRTSA
ncbi:MAG: hypothetical protein FWD18_06940 [Micrococcales bacterium]|nr:hypothetical protein [Micrococcales bacterium]